MLFSQKAIKKKSKRRESDSFLEEKNHLKISPQISKQVTSPKKEKRVSSYTSFQGSITIEAACVIPLFLLALLCFLYLFECIAIQITIRESMQKAGKSIAKEADETSVITASRVEKEIVNNLKHSNLSQSIIRNGEKGIDARETFFSNTTCVLYMTIKYKVRLPIKVFGDLGLEYSETMQFKCWTGYTKGEFNREEQQVYITDNASVYHKNYHCTYLDLSIEFTTLESLDSLRNDYRGKYYPCDKCKNTNVAGSIRYVTTSGSHYHRSLNCGGLKRRVYTIPLSEAIGKGACSRCGN